MSGILVYMVEIIYNYYNALVCLRAKIVHFLVERLQATLNWSRARSKVTIFAMRYINNAAIAI
jgi:hypothetical protein